MDNDKIMPVEQLMPHYFGGGIELTSPLRSCDSERYKTQESAIHDGTGTITSVGTAVTGVDTAFTEELAVGDKIHGIRYEDDTQALDGVWTAEGTAVVGTDTSFTDIPAGASLVADFYVPTETNGTGGFTSIGTAVTGAGSAFTGELHVGDKLYSSGNMEYQVVASIEDDEHLTLEAAFTGDVNILESVTFLDYQNATHVDEMQLIDSITDDNNLVLNAPFTLDPLDAQSLVIFVPNGAEFDEYKTIASITDDNNLVLEEAFTDDIVVAHALSFEDMASVDVFTTYKRFSRRATQSNKYYIERNILKIDQVTGHITTADDKSTGAWTAHASLNYTAINDPMPR